MRQITILIGLLVSLSISHAQEQKTVTDFQQIKAMVDSNRFKIIFTVATTHHSFYLQPTTPYSNQNIRIDSDSAFVVIRDSLAAGYLPYYGGGYSFPKTGIKGIVFKNKMIGPTSQTKGKRKKEAIIYQFAIMGINDSYRININIQHDGTCYLYVNSNRRGPISYIGQIVN